MSSRVRHSFSASRRPLSLSVDPPSLRTGSCDLTCVSVGPLEADSEESSATVVRESAGAAIVSTVKGFGHLSVSWCAYHFTIGFKHLYIYFDDPSEIDAVKGTLLSHFPAEALTLVPHDARLRKAWAELPGAEKILPHAVTEVQIRQQLNARHAMSLAVKHGLRWMLHIDADELFDPASAGDVHAHFAELDAADVESFCYMNFEAVPEAHGIVDPFKEERDL